MGSEFFFYKFLNLQYWYCVIYSLFGGRCTDTGSLSAGIDASVSAGKTKVGFWDWLFGSQAGTDSASMISHTGFLGSLFDAFTALSTLFGGAFSFLWSLYSAIAYTISGLLLALIAFSLFALFYQRMKERSRYGTLSLNDTVIHPLQDRWHQLLDGAMSHEPARWRAGILEADGMLGELLGRLGYTGSTTNQKMRDIPENAFMTLPFAWEAHRIKNLISTPTSNFILTQREAFRALKLYEQVFQEFDFI
ncbi:hypothetical protein EPO56_03055 [Patescibacteria group bacterium]|nr:MAG: hypothetical protein EPO56_03055 [Patescibacteria group bacterium]